MFLYRFMQFVKFNRGSADLCRYDQLENYIQRLMSSWMDILDPVTQAPLQVQQQMQADTVMKGARPDPERLHVIITQVTQNLRTGAGQISDL